MQDNRGEIGLAQKEDVDKANYYKSGEKIFTLFLDISNLRLESIFLLKPYTTKNSFCRLANSVEKQLNNCRLMYNAS